MIHFNREQRRKLYKNTKSVDWLNFNSAFAKQEPVRIKKDNKNGK